MVSAILNNFEKSGPAYITVKYGFGLKMYQRGGIVDLSGEGNFSDLASSHTKQIDAEAIVQQTIQLDTRKTTDGNQRFGLVEVLLDETCAGENDDDDTGGAVGNEELYSWESGYTKSWDAVQEIEGQLLYQPDADEKFKLRHKTFLQAAKRKRDTQTAKALLRNVLIVIDESIGMREPDFKPDRFNCVMSALEEFIANFFSVNPISQVGIIALKERQAQVISRPTANPADLLSILRNHRGEGCAGSASVQTGLERCGLLLVSYPPYANREVVILFGSINSKDASDIDLTIEDLKEKNVRVSIIGMGCELFVLKKICNSTGGTYTVAITNEHVTHLLSEHIVPLPRTISLATRLVPIGFPTCVRHTTASLCMCHNKPCLETYMCPKCHSRSCTIPSCCRVCGLHLASCSHIYRTNHNFDPLPLLPLPTSGQLVKCSACDRQTLSNVGQCPSCGEVFCFNCDVFIHDQLHFCPSCTKKIEYKNRGWIPDFNTTAATPTS